MDKETATEIQQTLKKVEGGKPHFFAFHPGASGGPELALELRRPPMAEVRRWAKGGLSTSLAVLGRVRAGENGVEFVTNDKSISGGVAGVQRALRSLGTEAGVTLLLRAVVLFDPNLDMSEVRSAPVKGQEGPSEEARLARQKAAEKLQEANDAWRLALEHSLSALLELSKQVGAEDDERSKAIAEWLDRLAEQAPMDVEGALDEVVALAGKGPDEALAKSVEQATNLVNDGLGFIESRAEVLDLVDANAYGVDTALVMGLSDPLLASLDELDRLRDTL